MTAGRAHIELRSLSPDELAAFTEEVEARLGDHDAVQWVEVNPIVRRVVVAFDPEAVSVRALVEIVDEVEHACEVHRSPFPRDAPEHPGDIEPLLRDGLSLCADLVGVGFGLCSRLVLVPSFVRADVGAFARLLEGAPPLRRALEHRMGAPIADVALGAFGSVTQGLAFGPFGPMVDVAHRTVGLLEHRARGAAWSRREQKLSPATAELEGALHVLARRHPAAGYRKLTSRLRRRGWPVNRKRIARLLRAGAFGRRRPKPDPKAEGRPFQIAGPNELWQTDLTSVWCGEDGWAYYTAVIDYYDRTILGWCFTHRCRALDVETAMTDAWANVWPHGIDPEHVTVTLRHDNGMQFTAGRYRDTARELGISLSRTAYRHPDGNAFIERLYRTYKQECVWPHDFASYDEALAATSAWVIDYNHERPHASLAETPPPPKPAPPLSTLTISQPDCQRPRGSLRGKPRTP